MTFEEMVQRTSPYLLCWIDLAMTPKKLTDIGQLRRIKRLADKFPVSIRLALDVQGGSIQFCDLFWLSKWNTDFPQDQIIALPDGYYEMTVCTCLPESGYWGDEQTIYIYFNKVDKMPELTWTGVPYLFTEE